MVESGPTTLVGRDESVAALRAALSRAGAGEPAVVLLSGETGVGKTRLVRELLRLESPTVLYGACVPMAGDPLPFAPLVQALRRLAATVPLGPHLQRLPELARLVPGAVPAAAHEGVPPSPFGLFQAVLDLLDRLGAAGPVLLAVEDVHWADRATLDLVRFLATNLATERLLLMVTYRVDAVIDGTPLAGWLAELGRLPVTERVAVQRLGVSDTHRLVRALLGDRVMDPQLLDSTLERSAGNPLFAEQLVLHGESGSGALPSTLHDLLRSRIAVLPERSRHLLRAAAVVGRPAPVALLAATAGTRVEELEPNLRAAMHQHVLELRRDDTVGFRHPAFCEVVYAELLPGERARLHAAAARALEADACDVASRAAVAGELARHWLGAGDLPRALDSAVDAALTAEGMYAFADAHTLFARAADLVDELPGTSYDAVRLLKHAAQAASLTGDGDEAKRLLERALARSSDPVARASLFTRLGSIHYLAGRGPEAEHCFGEALALLPEGQESVLVARVHAGLALFGAAWSRLDLAVASSARGLAVARAVGARREEGMVLSAMGVVASAQGRDDEAAARLREALAVAGEVGNPNDLATAYINLSHVLLHAGRYPEALVVCEEGTVALTRVGLARQSGSFLMANHAHALVDSGRLDAAAVVIGEALSHHPRGIRSAPVLFQAGRVAMVRGDLPLAWERLQEARAVIESESAPDAWLREVVEVLAEVELWSGRPAAAYELVREGLQLVDGTDELSFAGTLLALGCRALADQGESRRDPASRRELARLARPLVEVAGRLDASHRGDAAAAAWRESELARLARTATAEDWRGAAEAWEAVARPFLAGYCRWRETEARLDLRVDAEAISLLRRTHAAARESGAAMLQRELEKLAGWHRIDLVAPAQDADPGVLDAYALTPREVEVLVGLAQGRTNREIAERLFISVKTASVHVSNILRKLDVTGRQEAARVAHRLGVDASGPH